MSIHSNFSMILPYAVDKLCFAFLAQIHICYGYHGFMIWFQPTYDVPVALGISRPNCHDPSEGLGVASQQLVRPDAHHRSYVRTSASAGVQWYLELRAHHIS